MKAQPTSIILTPNDIANAVNFFATEESRYSTGQVLHTDVVRA
ncbi:hypothetical protein [Bacillus sp. EB106-08-02-XG196]|nr:hypothetical protein [Bacillus sp. EB106-08-02-XG196]